ncbi:thiazole tautomerase TenI [Bacillus sp. BGMRC 2118]|nr:thiazole tautomerase TenI [Bacillus sp. BGMRC 2118]
MGIHLISNGRLSAAQFCEAVQSCSEYVECIHIREKHLSASELFDYVNTLLDRGISSEKLIMHDRVDVAMASGVRRVQLTTRSLPVSIVKETFPSLFIGCSTHSLEEVKIAEAGGADFVLYGHVYKTTSKPGLEPRGITQVKGITSQTIVPLIAIGGITPENTRTVMQNGASGIAVMSGILDASNPSHSARQYWDALQEWKEVQGENKL